MSGGLMSGGLMSGGLMSGGLMSGGLMSAHRAPLMSPLRHHISVKGFSWTRANWTVSCHLDECRLDEPIFRRANWAKTNRTNAN